MTKVIALDAGHGLKTAGKQTPTGIKEWTLNDKVRDKVVKKLKDYDCKFIFPDNDEGNTDETLAARWNKYMSGDIKVDAMVSIHHNAYTGKWNNATGVEVFTDRNYTDDDLKLAGAIYKNLSAYTGLKGRGIKKENWAVINQNRIPAVLVEGGFMDSNKDYKVIISDAGQEGYAQAVAEGLIEFLKLEKKPSAANKDDFLPKRGYFKKGDVHANVGKIASFMRRVFPSYTSEKALGNTYGPYLIKAVTEFQKRTGLEPDGYFGPLTLAKLELYGFKR